MPVPEPPTRAPRTARVGIVMATYNRAHLLPAAVASVQAQTFTDWQLILVNDASTDNTQEVVSRLQAGDDRITMIDNDRYPHSCAGARQRGLDELRHEYVAFQDSDDKWPEYHLADLVTFLDENPDVDWVFGDLRRVDVNGRVIVESKLEQEWTGRPHFRQQQRGEAFVLDHDRLIESALRYDFNPGLQCSVIRRRVFERLAIRMSFCEDRLLTLEAAASGFTFAFFMKRHLDYLVHDGNVSGANALGLFEQRLKTNTGLAKFWEHDVPAQIPMTPERRSIIKDRLADHLVWGLGNNVYRMAGKRLAAIKCIGRGILLRPLVPAYWKSFFGTLLGV